VAHRLTFHFRPMWCATSFWLCAALCSAAAGAEPGVLNTFNIYRNWVQAGELDLRGAELSVYLRGDKLDVKGAKCCFWVFDSQTGTRWHYTAEPLRVSDGRWSEKQTILLKNDEALWHRSWSRNPQKPGGHRAVVVTADVCGFSKLSYEAIFAEIQKRCGLERSQFMLTCSHTHTGPALRECLHRSTDRGQTWQSIRFESEGIKPGASNHSTRNVLRLEVKLAEKPKPGTTKEP